jgi:hypothetical protein
LNGWSFLKQGGSCRVKIYTLFFIVSAMTILIAAGLFSVQAGEGDNWQAMHPEWLWCDGFETQDTLTVNYQDVSSNGMSIVTGEAFEGMHSLRQTYIQGQVDAGWIIRVNNSGFPDHVFMRWYHKFEAGFQGFPPKMARIRYRLRSGDWSSPYAVHCWLETDGILALDVAATNSTQANSVGWLPIARSSFSFADAKKIGKWICFEMEVKLNTPGATDGLYRLWADDSLIVERTAVDLCGATTFKINEMMLDCYWNEGSPKAQSRYYDNLVISKQKIGPVTGMAVRKSVREVRSLSRAQSHCSIVVANRRRTALISGEQVYDIRGQQMRNDQVRPNEIYVSIKR